ncbi:MAG TPA: ATP-binding protein [Polyangiaceae bacterium]|nr:ATP-binding protein [Polyangiaceae bacterium]
MPTVHLICGPPVAGRTTYATAIAKRTKGVRFTTDEWMATLFGADWPASATLEWMLDRATRCEAQMWLVAEQLIAVGTDAIMDIGLARREHRDRARMRVARTTAESKLHYLDVDREARLERLAQRNAERAVAQGFHVSQAMFDFWDRWFEPPTDDELYGAMIVCA